MIRKEKGFAFLKEKACCFTGHRLEKINHSEQEVRGRLRKEIQAAMEQGIDTFIIGMATGVDTWAALEVLDLKESGKDIHLVCAVPFPGFEQKRPSEQKPLYFKILDGADGMYYVCSKYEPGSYHERNKWMVDRCSLVIAVYNGTRSGTGHTIAYAQEKGRKLVVIDDSISKRWK